MRVALLSDIHGNSIALDAILADASDNGVMAYWVLGDLVALGHDPVGVLERLARLPNARFIRGNTDRYVVTGDRPPPLIKEVGRNPELLAVFSEVTGTFAWTLGALSATGWFDWLTQLPIELRVELLDGTQFLGVHASPGKDDGQGICPDISEDELIQVLNGCTAELICVGHTHLPVNRRVGKWHVVNLGSVSNPRYPDLRASYVILDYTSNGYTIHHRRVDYNREQVVALLKDLRHPGANFIINHMRGLMK
ncbi:MAG TPA: metallophosphoesterase family protein [Anaerolineales bacterium]